MEKLGDFLAFPMLYNETQQKQASWMSSKTIAASYVIFGALTLCTGGIYAVGSFIARKIIDKHEQNQQTKKTGDIGISQLTSKPESPIGANTDPPELKANNSITKVTASKASITPATLKTMITPSILKKMIAPSKSKTEKLIDLIQSFKANPNQPYPLATKIKALGNEFTIYDTLLDSIDVLKTKCSKVKISTAYYEENSFNHTFGILFGNSSNLTSLTDEERVTLGWDLVDMQAFKETKDWDNFELKLKAIETLVLDKLILKLKSMQNPSV